MKKLMLLLLITVIGMASFGQKTIILKPISKQMKLKANAVYREDVNEIIIESPKTMLVKERVVVTILNEQGKHHARFGKYYDSFTKIRELNVTSYNMLGKRIKKYSEKDFYDQAYVSSSTMYQDARFKQIEVASMSYPYTLVFESAVEHVSTLFIPAWRPYASNDASVIKSTYSVRYKAGLDVKFKELNVDSKGIEANEGNFVQRFWSVENAAVFEEEEKSVARMYVSPTVLCSLNNFEMDGYAGKLNSWQELGLWCNKLNQGRLSLPENAVSELKQLTDSIVETRDKVRAVYQYMQKRTRYVNVAIGIGGWQPFPADEVHNTGYGDCKGLTNYMRGLLDVVGVKSHYTLVKAGANVGDIMVDFPSSQFNHAILCVPLEQDTVWLECTSQQMPFNFLGNFTDNRHVLLVTDQGGKLAKTPSYDLKNSVYATKLTLKVLQSGDVEGFIDARYTGLAYDKRSYYLKMNDLEREKRIKSRLALPVLSLKKVEYSEEKCDMPSMTEKIDFSSKKYATITANRMFVEVNAVNKVSYVPERIRDRKTDFVIQRGYSDKDTVKIELPTGYAVEYLPKTFDISTEFGIYKTNVKALDGSLVFVREMHLLEGEYKAEKWDAFRNFYQEVKKADEVKLVLKADL